MYGLVIVSLNFSRSILSHLLKINGYNAWTTKKDLLEFNIKNKQELALERFKQIQIDIENKNSEAFEVEEVKKTYFNDFFEEVSENLNAVPDIKLGGVGVDCDDMYNCFSPREADVQLEQIIEEKPVIYKNSTKKRIKKKAKAKPSKTSVKSKRK